MPSWPDFDDVRRASERLQALAVRTPLLESQALNQLLRGRVLVKAEPLQRTGSFKFRGAYNCISRLDPAERKRGVVAYSSGNHAQGVAAAAALLEAPATIVMPRDAPRPKIENTRALGAEIVLYDRASESREEIAEALAAERGVAIVRPYDDPQIIAGQGSVGLEIAEQLEELKLVPDAVLVPVGGGGLISGTALGLHGRLPEVPLYGVEPEGFDDTARSLAAGRRLENAAGAESFCDALLAPTPGELTFAINRQHLAPGLAVSDADVAQAMACAFATLKLVIEPGGAVALAALLAGRFEVREKVVVVVASGGNVAPELFAQVLAATCSNPHFPDELVNRCPEMEIML